MSNQTLVAVALNDLNGIPCTYSRAQVTGLAIKSALTASLSVSGINAPDGLPVAWTVTAGTSGYVAPPSTGLCNSLSFAYGNAADLGKAILILQPT